MGVMRTDDDMDGDMPMIVLDGSFEEGGGAILRQALALSMHTGKSFKIDNIRKNRPKPGLAHQHLAAINAAAGLCGAEVTGNSLGSLGITFKPGPVKGGSHKIDIGTAGSITLLMQSLLLPSIFCGKKVSFTLTGGTDVSWSQPYDYFRSVFLPQMKRFGEVEATLFRRGYYPKGNGEVKVHIHGRYSAHDELPLVALGSQKKLLQIRGVSHASIELEPAAVSERQAQSARLLLRSKIHDANIVTEYSRSECPGSGITLWAVFGDEELDYGNPIILGADALGEQGKKAEQVGLEAAESLINAIGAKAPVDEHLADQLIPFMAVCDGGSIRVSKVTKHVLSNIYVSERFLDVKFSISENVISCQQTRSEVD
jgi:RNA 3'-phosphate cyclase